MTHTIIVKKVGEKPEVKTLPKLDLQAMKKLVGGHIELIRLSENIDLWLNEEGKLIGLKPNLWCAGSLVVGDVFLAGNDGEGETIGLSPEQVEQAMNFFRV